MRTGRAVHRNAVSRLYTQAGFALLGSATICATVERTARAKGQRRTEHAVLLEAEA